MSKRFGLVTMAAGVALLGWAATAGPVPAQDGREGPGAALGSGVSSSTYGSRELVTHFQEQQSGPTVLTVVQPQARVIAVYHIDRATGEINLKSVRDINFDLRLTDHNSGSPTPQEIRRMFELQQ
ncbi:MAG TPA: hypothetical protein VEQ85_14580 [Lacipirellulaceae bacterium]|nr:hypothetical protein [Lacipirellulaceae bacterium]